MAKVGAKPGVKRGSNGRTLAERFWSKVDIPVRPGSELLGDECWEWTGSGASGYGQLRYQGKLLKASRVSYELAYGPFDQALDVCHSCDNPPCVRPDHLFLGDARANARDMVEKGRNVWFPPPQPTHAQRARGERHGEARLTEDDVMAIRLRHADGESQYALAYAFGVTRPNIGFIVRRKTWAHVK